jgi:hypothetical protein
MFGVLAENVQALKKECLTELGRLKKPSAFLASTVTASWFTEVVLSIPGFAPVKPSISSASD